jgi:hypothetical protein
MEVNSHFPSERTQSLQIMVLGKRMDIVEKRENLARKPPITSNIFVFNLFRISRLVNVEI